MFVLDALFVSILVVKSFELISDPDVGELGVCFLSFFDLIASPDVEGYFPAILSSTFQLDLSVTQTLFRSVVPVALAVVRRVKGKGKG